MERPATIDDVNLILRLYEHRREPRMRQARAWFAKSFHIRSVQDFEIVCPPGSEENTSFRMVASYWEMVASFITSGVLNQELFFQSGNELLLCWERVRGVVPEVREASRNPKMFANLEIVARHFIDWMNAGSPEAYATWSERIKTFRG